MLHMEHTTSTAEQVSARVKALIEESGVTVVWLCGKTGIPRSTMLRRLDGHSAFNLNEIDRVATALRVPAELLLTHEAMAS